VTISLIPCLVAMFQRVSITSPIANAFAIPLGSLAVVPMTLLGVIAPRELAVADRSLVDEPVHSVPDLNERAAECGVAAACPRAMVPVLLAVLGVLSVLAPRGVPARWIGALALFANAVAGRTAATAKDMLGRCARRGASDRWDSRRSKFGLRRCADR
jgi:competence protein ComEC